jgi:signal transduction histidine kinase
MLGRLGRRIPPWALDAVLAVIFLVVAVAESQPRQHPFDGNSDGYQVGPYWWNVVVMVCFVAPLVIRRTAPRTSFLFMHGSFVLLGLVADHSVFFFANSLPSMLSTYTVARYGRGWLGRWAWVVAGAAFCLALYLGAPRAVIRYEASAPVGYFAVSLVAWMSGWILRRLHDQSARLADALEQLTAAQAAGQAAAVVNERARIALEMHDVVDHAVSLMVAQVTAARHDLEHNGIAAPRLEAAEQTGHQALLELRRTLGVLRERPDTDPQPLPDLAAMAGLAEHFRAAGLNVDLQVDEQAGLPASVQLAAYRILQEAMTNALKHGGQAWVSAAVLATGHELTITVRNPIGETPMNPLVPSGQHGLVGMRERVAMFGGSLRTGRASESFEVRAVLPLPSDSGATGIGYGGTVSSC